MQSKGRISRRDFLRASGLGLFAVGASSIIDACSPAPTAAPAATATAAAVKPTLPPTSAPEGATLKMWWWGEQEAPGLEKWLKDSIAQFSKDSGTKIDTLLQDTNSVVSEFQTASAAKNAPDLQFLWNGTYHMESVWLGYVEPLNGLIADDVLKASNATALSVFGGKQYRLGWYSEAALWAFNKDMFDKAGLNADQPPATFDELMAAADKLKATNVIPISAGIKDGQWGDWYLTQAETASLDTPGDAIELFTGALDWRDPRYYAPWARLEQLWKAGFMNPDMNSIDLYPGIDLFSNAKSAIAATVVPLLDSHVKKLGAEKIGVMVFPASGPGKLNGKPVIDSAGLGISSQSNHKEDAAKFLAYLATKERVAALWDQVKAMPTNRNFDATKLTDALWKQVWDGWISREDAAPYIGGLMPGLFWTDAMFVNAQKIISGEYTPEQAGENAYNVSKQWREQNPDLLEKYQAWAEELKGAN